MISDDDFKNKNKRRQTTKFTRLCISKLVSREQWVGNHYYYNEATPTADWQALLVIRVSADTERSPSLPVSLSTSCQHCASAAHTSRGKPIAVEFQQCFSHEKKNRLVHFIQCFNFLKLLTVNQSKLNRIALNHSFHYII